MNFLPIIIVGGAIALMSGRKKRTSVKKEKALPPADGRGTIFEGDTDVRPSGIRAKVGERFSVSFFFNPSIPGVWKLNASPPDNSIKHVSTEHDKIEVEGVGGATGKDVYIFEGVKPGKGSLVFHMQTPWLEGQEPPTEIVEILTEIS